MNLSAARARHNLQTFALVSGMILTPTIGLTANSSVIHEQPVFEPLLPEPNEATARELIQSLTLLTNTVGRILPADACQSVMKAPRIVYSSENVAGTTVKVTLGDQGIAKKVEIEQSSGAHQFDNAVMVALYEAPASLFDPVPFPILTLTLTNKNCASALEALQPNT